MNGQEVTDDDDTESLQTRADIPADVLDRVTKMQHENTQLKLLLTKFDHHTQQQEDEIEALRKKQKSLDEIRLENKELKNQLNVTSELDGAGTVLNDPDALKRVNSDLEKDNNALMDRLVTLEEELGDMRLEKDSLVSTLQLMQDELMASENVRQRKKTGSFTES